MTFAVVVVTNSNVAGIVNQLVLSGPAELKEAVISATHSVAGMDLNEHMGKDGIITGTIPLYQLLNLVKQNGYTLKFTLPGGKGNGCSAHDKYVFEKNEESE